MTSPPQKEFGAACTRTILAPARCSAWTRSYPSAAPRRWRCLRWAPRSAGHCRSPAPATSTAAAAKRLFAGRIGIDSEAGPTEIAVLADDSALASDVAADLDQPAEHGLTSARAGHRLGAGREAVEAELAAGRADQAQRAGGRGAGRPAVRDHPGRRPGPGPRQGQRLRGRYPGDPVSATGTRSPPGSSTRARSSSAADPGLAGRLRGRPN